MRVEVESQRLGLDTVDLRVVTGPARSGPALGDPVVVPLRRIEVARETAADPGRHVPSPQKGRVDHGELPADAGHPRCGRASGRDGLRRDLRGALEDFRG